MGSSVINQLTSVARSAASLWSRNNCTAANVAWKIIFPLQLAILCVITIRLTTVLLGGGATYTEFHNTYCQQNTNPNIQGPKVIGNYTEDCVYDYKFQKVLYFWCDGISWDTADPIFANFPSNNNLFKVRHELNPWSAWVFATFMTGKAERNMGEIKNDNLMYQFYLAGMKAFLGAEHSRVYVFDQLDLSFQHSDAIKFYPGVTADQNRMFHWLFECQSSSDPAVCSKKVFDEAKASDRSMFFESFILDHRVHEELTKYGDAVLALRDQLAKDLLLVKQWVDANPEYLLVVVSDHGQKSSAAEVDIHGNWRITGNEGWALFYNPNFDFSISTASQPVVLKTVDVAPTFWQFFSANGVSLPAESVGKVYPVTSSVKTQFKALQTNAKQIRSYLKRENSFTYSDALWNSAHELYDAGRFEEAVVAMDEFISGLTEKFIEEGAKLPYRLPIAIALLHLVITVALQFGSRSSLWTTARVAGYGLLASPYVAWIIIDVFFTQASEKEDRHQLYAYAIPLCAFLASYTMKLLSQAPNVPQKKTHKLMHFELLEGNATLNHQDEEKVDDTTVTDDGEELCRSTEILIPTEAIEEERQIVYFEIYDLLKQRKLLDGLLAFVNYIFGSQKVPRSSLDLWLMYSVMVFAIFSCFEIPFSSKRFIYEDISGLYKHPPFWHTVALAVLFLEFRWQRILLTSNLELPEKKKITLLQQITHPSFLPLNIKTVCYFVLLVLAFDAEGSTARAIYAITFIHIVILLFCPAYLQRDLFLPLFVLTFVINTSKEKILLCMFVSVLNFFSNTLERHSVHNRHILPTVVVIMISLGHFYFSVLYQIPYSINQISLNIPGIDDITKYPNFSVMMMGIHYMGVFLMLIPFIIRLTTPSPPALRPFKVGCFTLGHVPIPSAYPVTSTSAIYKRQVMTLLTFCSSLTVFLYYVFSTSELTDTPLIWTFTICAVAIGYGATVVCHEMLDGLVKILVYVKQRLVTRFLL